jgi:hypothetical protein
VYGAKTSLRLYGTFEVVCSSGCLVLLCSSASQILSACDRIGQKKIKRRFPLARVEGTFLQFFPVSGWPSYNSAVLSLARKAKTLVVVLARAFSERNSPPNISSFLYLNFFSSFKQIAIRYNIILPNRNNALSSNSNIILF